MQGPFPLKATSDATSVLITHQDPPEGWWSDTVVQRTIKDYTLIFPINRKERKVLLGLKKRGFGMGKWNGFGGKPENGEDLQACAIRELCEESGLLVQAVNMQEKGQLMIPRPSEGSGISTATLDEPVTIAIKIFYCDTWSGQPGETDEMLPRWFPFNALPLDMMWPEASLYLKPLLEAVEEPCRIIGRIDYHSNEDGISMTGWWIAKRFI